MNHHQSLFKRVLILISILLISTVVPGCNRKATEILPANPTVTPASHTVVTPSDGNDDEILFVTDEWLPYVSKEKPETGAATELVLAICKVSGIQIRIDFVPWKRAESMVGTGEAFASYPYAVTPERLESYNFSDIIFYGANPFFYYDLNPRTPSPINYNSPTELKKFQIGSMRGSFLSSKLKEYGIDSIELNTYESAASMMKSGRLDYFIDEQAATFAAFSTIFPDEINHFKILDKMLISKIPNAVLISRSYPNSAALLKRFNDGLKAIKASGEYDLIADKYHLVK